jgi:transposase
MEKAKRKYRKFTDEFKREAVRLLNENPTSGVETAKKLGIGREYLYRWRDEQRDSGAEAFRGNGKRTAEQERIRELESEVRRLQMERDFLKKTAAYFAKDDE